MIMSSELKPCPSCCTDDIYCEDSHGRRIWYINCNECGMTGPISHSVENAYTEWNSLPRKIKLTKDLPTEAGDYYYSTSSSLNSIEIVSVWCFIGTDQYMEGDYPVEEIGGYWAKVDQSMFEVCDE